MGTIDLLGILKDTAFLTGFTDEFTSVATREALDKATLRRRPLLCLLALGTNMGIRQMAATGEHGEDEGALRRVRASHITRENLRAAIARVVNATLAAREVEWWGEATSDREWADRLTPEDRCGLSPLFWTHINPYGHFYLNMDTRLDFAAA